MKVKYFDIIDQTFDFPQKEFQLNESSGELKFHNLPLLDIIKEHGTPLKISYLPKITAQIKNAKSWFERAFKLSDYKGKYHYSYCTKSSHFSFVIEEALKNDIHLETSSTFDIDIIQNLHKKGRFDKNRYVICNGFKVQPYLKKIAELRNEGFENTIAIFDNVNEPLALEKHLKKKCKVGIRIASEEEPKFEFYTSRLGIGYKDVLSFYKKNIEENELFELKMLHFFINTGIKDSAYYWSELLKAVRIYSSLKKICPSLDSLNIGGGLPIKNSLGFQFDYEYMIEEIVHQIKVHCDDEGVPEPDIFTEFGSYTVGESGALFLKVLDQKQQNDKERWSMIDSSFMTNLPDSWALNNKFLLLAINNWNDPYERVLLGGLTCDSDDYYNSEAHSNAIYLPTFSEKKDQFIGFFHTGAYQDAVGGYGGIHHCLMPQPKHLVINVNDNGEIEYKVFREEQKADEVLDILGY